MRQRGFTLLELILVIILLVVLTAAVVAIFIVGLKTFSFGYSRSDILQDLTSAMEKMVREIRQADQGTLSVTGTTQIDFQISSTAYQYIISSNELRRSIGAGAAVLQLTDLTANSSFTLSGNLLTIYLEITRGGETVALRSNAQGRNQ